MDIFERLKEKKERQEIVTTNPNFKEVGDGQFVCTRIPAYKDIPTYFAYERPDNKCFKTDFGTKRRTKKLYKAMTDGKVIGDYKLEKIIAKGINFDFLTSEEKYEFYKTCSKNKLAIIVSQGFDITKVWQEHSKEIGTEVGEILNHFEDFNIKDNDGIPLFLRLSYSTLAEVLNNEVYFKTNQYDEDVRLKNQIKIDSETKKYILSEIRENPDSRLAEKAALLFNYGKCTFSYEEVKDIREATKSQFKLPTIFEDLCGCFEGYKTGETQEKTVSQEEVKSQIDEIFNSAQNGIER